MLTWPVILSSSFIKKSLLCESSHSLNPRRDTSHHGTNEWIEMKLLREWAEGQLKHVSFFSIYSYEISSCIENKPARDVYSSEGGEHWEHQVRNPGTSHHPGQPITRSPAVHASTSLITLFSACTPRRWPTVTHGAETSGHRRRRRSSQGLSGGMARWFQLPNTATEQRSLT